MAELYSQEKR